MAADTAQLRDERASQAEAQRISVCHVASGDAWAGAESQVASLLRALAGHEQIALSAILFNEGRLAEEIRGCGIEVKVIPEAEHSFWELLAEARRFVRARKFDLLHSHRYKENLLTALLARRCRVPCVVRTQHGLPEPFSGLRHWKQRGLQFIDRAVARYLTDRVISVSEDLRNELTRHLDPGKVVVIHNGIDTDGVRSTLRPEEAKKRLGISPECPVIGTAGRLEPVKRLDLFLHAATRIGSRLPQARFIIAGQGGEMPPLRALSACLGLEQRALFLGHRDDVYDVLRAMDILVFTSDHEGLPMALLEALALGIPVVARRVGGLAEVLAANGCGTLVDSSQPEVVADACLSLLANPRGRAEMGARAQLVAQHYRVENTAFEVAELYRSLLAGRTGFSRSDPHA